MKDSEKLQAAIESWSIYIFGTIWFLHFFKPLPLLLQARTEIIEFYTKF